MAFLRDSSGNDVPLKGPIVAIGRSDQNVVILRHGSVSRIHAEIRIGEEGVQIKDLGSRLGTYVNGRRITEAKLNHGDEIRFGQVVYRYIESPGKKAAVTSNISTSVTSLIENVRALRSGFKAKEPSGEVPNLAEIETGLRKALDSAELLDREHRRLTTLYEVAGILNDVREQSLLLEKVIDLAIDVLHAENGFLMLRNAAGDLEIQVARGLERRDVQEAALSMSIAREVSSTGRAIITENAFEDTRFKEQRSVVGLNLRAILCVPLKDRQQKVIGVIYLGSRFSRFQREDIDLLEAFANQAAVAIENLRLIEETKRSEKLSAIGRMASTIIHDLKNPIASVSGWAEMISLNAQDPQLKNWSTRILLEIDRLVGMTGEILAYASGEERLDVKKHRIGEVLEEALESVEESMQRSNVALVKDFRFDGCVMLDRTKFSRVVFNIANNAREAMPDGGTFTATMTDEDSRIRIAFADTGCGMPEAIRLTAFEPFVTYGKRRGIGLGMSIVKRLVEVHGGEVSIESAQGKGTTINVWLPVHRATRGDNPSETTGPQSISLPG